MIKDKAQILFLLTLGWLWPILSFADGGIEEAKRLHDRFAQNVEMGFYSIAADTYQYDTANLDRFTGLKDRAVKGNVPDPLSPDDVDEWYEFLSQPYRSYGMNFHFYAKGKKLRTRISAPKKTFRLWESLEEYIINSERETLFYINHKAKFIKLYSIANELNSLQYLFFNPIVQLYPLSYIEDVSSVKTEKHGKYIKIVWDNPNPKPSNGIVSIQALLDPSHDYVSTKTIVKGWKRISGVYRLFLSEHSDFVNQQNHPFPQKMVVMQLIQYDDNEIYHDVPGLKILKKDIDVSIDKICTKDITDFNSRYFLDLDADSVSTKNIDDSVFWPIVPKEYTFSDYRYMTPEFYQLDRDEQNKIDAISGGVGPHEFPLTIEY